MQLAAKTAQPVNGQDERAMPAVDSPVCLCCPVIRRATASSAAALLHPVTICGQTIMLTSGELAEALYVLPEKKEKLSTFIFSRNTHSRKSGNYMDAAGVRRGVTYIVLC